MSKKSKQIDSGIIFKIVILLSLLAIFDFILVTFKDSISANGAYLMGIQPSNANPSLTQPAPKVTTTVTHPRLIKK